MAVGLLVIRVVVGLTLAGHGAQKLLGWFGGGGLRAAAAMFDGMGFRPGRVFAVLASAGEVTAGLLLVLGLMTQFAAAIIVAVMLVAAVTVHSGKGFFLQTGGFEYTLILAAVAVGLAGTGPGALSLDHLLELPGGGSGWALFALLAGGAGGGMSLLMRRRPAESAANR